ncbi:MAG: hypothetical protein LBC18_08745 [Opitutaceae bacterium]|jgi:hypothetical protein|nr:hypothetical protein [Opitutaceae bacterium]
MSEKPILFSAPMVLAYLAGRKSVTRRVVKDRAGCLIRTPGNFRISYPDSQNGFTLEWLDADGEPTGEHIDVRPPPVTPGDTIWVKETWRADILFDNLSPKQIFEYTPIKYEADGASDSEETLFSPGRIRQSIFMRRWMSRIVTPCVSLRVERLQDITESDAKAEGCTLYKDGKPIFPLCNAPFNEPPEKCVHRASFYKVWQTLNANRAPWDSNPWVWVISFRQFSPTGRTKETTPASYQE